MSNFVYPNLFGVLGLIPRTRSIPQLPLSQTDIDQTNICTTNNGWKKKKEKENHFLAKNMQQKHVIGIKNR